MPRYRNTVDAVGTIVGKLLLAIAKGPETSASLAAQLGVSPRQTNRYIVDLIEAGWQIEREGEWLKHDYFFKLTSPKLVLPAAGKPKTKKSSKPAKKAKES